MKLFKIPKRGVNKARDTVWCVKNDKEKEEEKNLNLSLNAI